MWSTHKSKVITKYHFVVILMKKALKSIVSGLRNKHKMTLGHVIRILFSCNYIDVKNRKNIALSLSGQVKMTFNQVDGNVSWILIPPLPQSFVIIFRKLQQVQSKRWQMHSGGRYRCHYELACRNLSKMILSIILNSK